jgi:hypothetical protein
MPRLMSRRTFANSMTAATLGAAAGTFGEAAAQSGAAALTGVSRGGVKLRVPAATPAGEVWRYGIAFPFQAGPSEAALFCNIRREHAPGFDYEAGTDVVVFDAVSKLAAATAVPVSRNHEEANPRSQPPDRRSVMVKYPARGGFVPFAARRDDGSPHPHAGTGFAICEALAWPAGEAAGNSLPDRKGILPYRDAERHEYFELAQLRYDGAGKRFQLLATEHISPAELLPGWTVTNTGIVNAVADGDDLLLAMSAGRADARAFRAEQCRSFGYSAIPHHDVGAGVTRWRRGARGWRPVEFVPVTGEDNSLEASLVRDIDGSLLFTARGARLSTENDIRIWRSSDGGRSWTLQIRVRGAIAGSLLSINRAADGTPFVAANLYDVLVHPVADYVKLPPGDPTAAHLVYKHHAAPETASAGVRAGGWLREKLALWPLTRDRSGLAPPLSARDCRAEFGSPPGGSVWIADTPSAAAVRLADGAWHTLLGYRVAERAEVTHQADPTPHTGIYLEEVTTAGPAVPVWRF